MRVLVLSTVLGCVGSVAIAVLTQSPGRHWTDPIVLVGWMAGAVVSGNTHAPNEVAIWTTVFVLTSCLSYLAIQTVRYVGTRVRNARRR